MTIFLQYAIVGIATGAVYTLLAQGVVVIHRASGIVNFSQGGFAVMAGFFFASLTQAHGWSTWPAFAVVAAGATVVGVLVYWIAMRPLRNASQLTQVFATLAVLLIMEGAATVPWAGETVIVFPYLPSSIVHVGGVVFNISQVVLVAIAIGVTMLLWGLTRFTLPGLAMRGLAENRRATASLGWSPDALATSAWALGGLVGAVGGMLIAPVTGVTVGNMTLFVVPSLAAALVGGFTSFPLTLLGAVVIGILQAEATNYINVAGAQDAVPFLALVLLLTIRGRGLPLRGHVSAKFAELGTGRISWRGAMPAALIFGVLMAFVFSANLDAALIASLAFAIILLSVVVLTGYAGQLSLAQLTFGGVGALIAGRLVEDAGFTFLPALLVGIIATVPIGAIFALPALRTRGMALAMVTLGMATAVASVVFSTTSIVGGIGAGTPINQQKIFGWNITALLHPGRYGVITLALLTLCALAVLNLRRSRAGRRLIAVRTNERAAAALGVNVYAAKVYAFAVAAAIAALGGILLAFQFETIDYSTYDSFNSVLAGSYSVIGGVGYVGGGVQGSILAQGGFGTWFLDLFGTSVTNYLPLIGGIGLLVMLLQNPNGLQSANLKLLGLLKRRLRRRSAVASDVSLPSVAITRVTPGVLEVRDLAVNFGGVQAVDGVDLTLRAGTISGLIGPNGAGKTSAIDAITGFVRPARGSVRLNGVEITRWPTYRRARAGVSRSFQSLELFEGVSVRENLLTACEDRDFAAYATNLVVPGKRTYAAAAIAAIREFGLEPDLDLHPAELPYGRRRLVAIARAVASEPSVLLLDEPAAGLDENEAVEFARLIRRLADTWGLAILVVEHDMSLVMSICDELTVIDFGRQIAHGTPHEIRHNPAVIAAYLGEPEDDGEPGDDRALARGTAETGRMTVLLSAEKLDAGYDRHPVVRGFDLQVEAGEVVALLGPNGAGKTTTILTIAGDLPPIDGVVRFAGLSPRASLHRRARKGLALVTEERSVLMGLSVRDNLRLGRCDVARALDLFPELERLYRRPCGLLSGGEQQMVTLARALARRPTLLLADELSLGLGPLVVRRLLAAVRKAADEDGIGALLVEQHVSQVLKIADRAVVMRRGRIVLSGTAAEVKGRVSEIEDSYISDVQTESRDGAAGPGNGG